ncbi:hypothetical protein AHAS_Ahas04G0109500 [Arachis hypogaea]
MPKPLPLSIAAGIAKNPYCLGCQCCSILPSPDFDLMALDRLNSPTTFEMPLEVLGHELQFTQDPNSKHLGTKVWDSSLVFAKFLERNCRKGRFSPAKLKGKRVIELGTGYGVSGFGNVTNDF